MPKTDEQIWNECAAWMKGALDAQRFYQECITTSGLSVDDARILVKGIYLMHVLNACLG